VSTLDRKIIALTDGKLAGDGAGTFTGYASLFGVLDSQGDVVLKGAYAATIPQFLERGFIAWGHDWNDPVATITTAEEDDRGLLLTADFHSDPDSQRARIRTQERLARQKFMGLSIGYTIPDGGAEFAEGARLLKQIDLYETSLVTVPALRDAGVVTAKQQAAPCPECAKDALDRLIATADAYLVEVKRGQEFSAANRAFLMERIDRAVSSLDEIRTRVAETDPVTPTTTDDAGKAAGRAAQVDFLRWQLAELSA
jgi:HK97 family phage prohead protease